jgi:EAL domain-containing protein (putative c-di-GMP-specific phosphodiesterase class I)
LRSIAAICAELGLATIAEGVETRDHLRAIEEAGIDVVQGYLHAPPLEPWALARWLDGRSG